MTAGAKWFLITVLYDGGDLSEVQFWNKNTQTLGPLSEATPLNKSDWPTMFLQGAHLVEQDKLLEFLSGILKSKQDLFALEEFHELSGDSIGNPNVFSATSKCDGCGETSTVGLPSIVENINCPVCQSTIANEPSEVNWIGPSNATLVELWERLPNIYTVYARVEVDGTILEAVNENGRLVLKLFK